MLRRAALAVVVILAAVAASLLAAAATLDYQALDSGLLSRLPACSARLAGGACALCGISHSLVAMAHGDWREARRLNAAGPWLFGFLITWTALGAALVAVRRRPPRL